VTLTKELTEAVWSITSKDLADKDLEAARMLLLDHIVVTAGGAAADSACAARRWARGIGDDGSRLPLIGWKGSLAAVPAAAANAVAAHSIEFDDVHNASSLHPGAVIFPAAMAMTSIIGSSPSDFLTAVVRGYEVMCRVGRAANAPAEYARHFHPTATVGHLGAAATCASLLKLDQTRAVWALGIASTMAGGTMQFLVDGSWTKRLHPALAVQNGIHAARLAAEGYLGGEDGIGGSRGFLASHSADPHPERVLADFGSRPLEIRSTSIKAHTCCRYNQGPIDAVLALRLAHGFDARDVVAATIGIPSVAVDIVAEPRLEKIAPKSVVDAQFSLPFSVAVALVRGRAGLSEYTEVLLDDPTIVRLMELVDYKADREIDRFYPEEWRAWARISLRDGSIVSAQVDHPKGDPANALTRDELLAKVDELTTSCWDVGRQRRIVNSVARFGDQSSFSELIDALTIPDDAP